MKRMTALILVLALLGSLAGCAKTPETVLVGQKDMDRLVEQAQADPEGNALKDIAASTPKDYVWSTSAYDGRVTVEVNAAVKLPELDTMPTYQISAGEFTQAQVDGMVAYLYGDETLYDISDSYLRLTKEEVQDQITEINELLAAGPSDPRWLNWASVYDFVDGTGKNASEEEVRYELESTLETLKSDLETAPDKVTDDLPISDGKLHERKSGLPGLVLDVIGESLLSLTVGSQEKTAASSSIVWLSQNSLPNYNLNNAVPAEGCAGYEEAKALADGFFEACGTEMSLLSAYQMDDGIPEDGTFINLRNNMPLTNIPQEATHTGFVFYYTTGADGLPVAYDADGGYKGTADKSSPQFDAMWTYEYAYIVVDDEGICSIDWYSPTTEKERISENTGLISFEDAKVIFEDMITVPYEGELAALDAIQESLKEEEIEDARTYALEISAVFLDLIRTRSMGGERTGILTPAWVFYGSIGGTGAQAGIVSQFPRIVFAINAIDGTVIDVLRGY